MAVALSTPSAHGALWLVRLRRRAQHPSQCLVEPALRFGIVKLVELGGASSKLSTFNRLRSFIWDRQPSQKTAQWRDGIRFQLIGFSTVFWARVEIALDIANQQILLDVRQNYNREIPINLSAKVVLFRKAHANCPELARVSIAGAALVERIQRITAMRHDIIHGVADEQLPNFTWTLRRHIYPDGDIKEIERIYTLEEIAEFAEQAGELAVDLNAHIGLMREAIGRYHKSDNASR